MDEKENSKENSHSKDSKHEHKKQTPKQIPNTLKITNEREIALDFAAKVYQRFNEMIKSIVLFGSSAKQVSTPLSDIDIIILTDDVSIKWDLELIAWYREELGKLIKANPYKKALHINTVKLSTWWDDLIRGDPIVINIIRYGDPLIDHGGFFSPLKVLLQEGKIKSTPEAIYTLLQRAPIHMSRTQDSLFSAIDGLYWACVDSAHAALIAAKVMPPSPEHIPEILEREFVSKKMLKRKFADYYHEIHKLAKDIIHGENTRVTGKEVDEWTEKTNEFVKEMAYLVDKLVKS